MRNFSFILLICLKFNKKYVLWCKTDRRGENNQRGRIKNGWKITFVVELF